MACGVCEIHEPIVERPSPDMAGHVISEGEIGWLADLQR
jgi:hypothetical protein